MWTAEQIRLECFAKGGVLQQQGETREGPLGLGHAGQAQQRRPDGRPFFGSHLDTLLQQAGLDPLARPRALAIIINVGQRLKRDRSAVPEIIVDAAESQGRRSQRATHVEDQKACAGVAPKL